MFNILKREIFTKNTKSEITKESSFCQLCLITINYGECAHIVAAGHKGPRNKQELVKAQIISDSYDINAKKNGIYLCANCHTKIDKYPARYTFEYLMRLKDTSNIKIIRNSSLIEQEQNSSLIEQEQNSSLIEQEQNSSLIEQEQEQEHKQNSVLIEPIVHHQLHQCPLCHKICSGKSGLTYHINHNVCQKTDKTCVNCGKIFYSRRNPSHHISQNVCQKQVGDTTLKEESPRTQPALVDGTKMKLNLLSKYDDLSKEDLIRQLFKMEGKFEALTQTINNNSNNIIVFPKEFGKEDMEHIKN